MILLSFAIDPSLTKEIEKMIAELRNFRKGNPNLELGIGIDSAIIELIENRI